jgi:hypothetical protein
MLILFTFLSTLAFAGKNHVEPTGPAISNIAAHYLKAKPRLTMEACNGLVLDILADAGIHMKGRVHDLWAQSRDHGWTHQKKNPRPGDIVFWHRTYDRNRNGKVDDRHTHIGVVIRVDNNDTIHMVHRGSRGIRPIRMNLHHPNEYKIDGEVSNDYLAANGYGRKDERLSGQLFAGFATIGKAIDTPKVAAKEMKKPKEATKLVRSTTVQGKTNDSTMWDEIEPRLRRRIVNGRGIYAGPVRSLNCKQIWAVRNAIFARHGFAFQTPSAQDLFASKEWYTRNIDVTQQTAASYLTSMDYENLEVVVRIEKKKCQVSTRH